MPRHRKAGASTGRSCRVSRCHFCVRRWSCRRAISSRRPASSGSIATRSASDCASSGFSPRRARTGTESRRAERARPPPLFGVDSHPVRPYARPMLLVVLATACAAVGTEPIPGQPAHHVEGGFRNTDPAFQTDWAAARPSDVPRVASDAAALRANVSAPTVTWIGHATVLVQLQGTNLLTDPHWGERASLLSWAGPKRLQPPGLAFED